MTKYLRKQLKGGFFLAHAFRDFSPWIHSGIHDFYTCGEAGASWRKGVEE
jgi:hypothetical protein